MVMFSRITQPINRDSNGDAFDTQAIVAAESSLRDLFTKSFRDFFTACA